MFSLLYLCPFPSWIHHKRAPNNGMSGNYLYSFNIIVKWYEIFYGFTHEFTALPRHQAPAFSRSYSIASLPSPQNGPEWSTKKLNTMRQKSNVNRRFLSKYKEFIKLSQFWRYDCKGTTQTWPALPPPRMLVWHTQSRFILNATSYVHIENNAEKQLSN